MMYPPQMQYPPNQAILNQRPQQSYLSPPIITQPSTQMMYQPPINYVNPQYPQSYIIPPSNIDIIGKYFLLFLCCHMAKIFCPSPPPTPPTKQKPGILQTFQNVFLSPKGD